MKCPSACGSAKITDGRIPVSAGPPAAAIPAISLGPLRTSPALLHPPVRLDVPGHFVGPVAATRIGPCCPAGPRGTAGEVGKISLEGYELVGKTFEGEERVFPLHGKVEFAGEEYEMELSICVDQVSGDDLEIMAPGNLKKVGDVLFKLRKVE